jgi:hypothetical protein
MTINNQLASLPQSNILENQSVASLAQLWAKKYMQKLVDPETEWQKQLQMGREQIANKLLESLRGCSAKAWTITEQFLDKEVQKHGIDHQLINPWHIAQDIFFVYEKALTAYSTDIIPSGLSVIVSSDMGDIRKKYTEVDPRVVGFVSMQFHHTGQLLLEPLHPKEKKVVNSYFKVIDDHLYMPLQRAYNAAAQHEYDSPVLAGVRSLLPVISQIAKKVYRDTTTLYPNYQCYTAPLNDENVRISSIRDIEMFQVYLCVCTLEQSISLVQQELFPLCVMLYPALNVGWELVQQLLDSLDLEIQRYLGIKQVKLFKPYLQAMEQMFASQVFSDDTIMKVNAS